MPVQNTAHRHEWVTRSSHVTSDGLLRYRTCSCGRWSIVLASEAVVVGDVAGHTGAHDRRGDH